MSTCGFVALIGPTNAGKSTLLNALLGFKNAAVSRKVNTTQHRIRGVLVRGQAQIVFVDTPGFSDHPRNAAPQDIAPEAAAEADRTLLLLDARRVGSDPWTDAVIEKARGIVGLSVVLNKIDTIAREKLPPLAAGLQQTLAPERIFMVSALTGDGLEAIPAFLAERMPAGPHLFNARSDLTPEAAVEEMLREHIYDFLHDELPYTVKPETDSIVRRRDGSMKVHASLRVPEERHKPMLIGVGGAVLKRIGERARADLTEFFGAPVHLFLNVKVG